MVWATSKTTAGWIAAFVVGLLVACAPAGSGPAEVSTSSLFFGESVVTLDQAADQVADVTNEFVTSEELFAECVIGLGYDYEPRILRVEYVDVVDGRLPTIADDRRSNGYGIMAGPDHYLGFRAEIRGGYVGSNAEQFVQRVLGDGEGGCNELYFFADIQDRLVEERFAGNAPPDRLVAHPKIVNAEQEWVRCMAELGYSFGSRVEAPNSIMEMAASLDSDRDDVEERKAELALLEIEVAVADLDCFLLTVNPAINALMADQ